MKTLWEKAARKNKRFFSLLVNTKIIFCLLILVGLLFPFQIIKAFWKELGNYILAQGLHLVVRVIHFLASLLLKLSAMFLDWVISPNFISLPYTTPGDPPNGNPIIATGLSITQGFANIILVLVLVYIGLATILRLAGYETKKLLVYFIIVALLVNFSPVICGLIVDASNIVAGFFFKEIRAQSFGERMTQRVDTLYAGFGWGIPFAKSVSAAAQIIVISAVLFALALAFWIFAFIFIFRYLVIWLLVILSPIAFVFYILPGTKKFWDLWWNQFIQWSFIGVTCGFFLYLALTLVLYAPAEIKTPTTGQGVLLDSILPYIVCVGFAYLGLIFGLQTSAMGASTVIGLAKRGAGRVRRGAGWTGAKAWKGMALGERKLLPGWKKDKETGKRTFSWVTPRTAVKGATAKWEKTPFARWFLPDRLRLYGQHRPAIDKASKEAESYDSPTLAGRITSKADIGTKAVGDLMKIVERGDPQDLMAEWMQKYKKEWKKKKKTGEFEGNLEQFTFSQPKFRKEMGGLLQIAFKAGYSNTIFRSFPRIARLAPEADIPGYNKFEGTAEEKEKAAVGKAVSETRSKHLPQWEKEEPEDKDVLESYLAKSREMWVAGDNHVKGFQKTSLTKMDTTFSEFVERLPEYKDLAEAGKYDKIEELLRNLTPEEIKVEVEAKVRADVEAEVRKELSGLPEKNIKAKIEDVMGSEETQGRIDEETQKRREDPRNRAVKQSWEKYREDIKQRKGGEGYFRALEDRRFRTMGWREAQYITPGAREPEEKEKFESLGGAAAMPTPPGTYGVGEPPETPPSGSYGVGEPPPP